MYSSRSELIASHLLAVMHSASVEYHQRHRSFAVSDSRYGVSCISASLWGGIWRVSFSGELGAASSLCRVEGERIADFLCGIQP